MSLSRLKPLAISMGEPAGVGPELICMLHAQRGYLQLPPFVVYGDAELLRARAQRLNLDIKVDCLKSAMDITGAENSLAVVQIGTATDTPGQLDEDNAPLVVGAIRRATQDCIAGDCRGLITAPIHKAALYDAGFDHPGHTEFIATLCSDSKRSYEPVMMLAVDTFRAIPLTIHIPLVDVPGHITKSKIEETCRIAEEDLRARFGIENPRIGVTGLNPHAGENGTIGTEEVEVIGPAIESLRKSGMNVEGPLPGDTVFHPPHWKKYDVVIAMYHDQALIPVKAIGFDKGVNVTLGLPIVRTSPDHGTAFGLAGSGKASFNSMLAAIRLADQMSLDHGSS